MTRCARTGWLVGGVAIVGLVGCGTPEPAGPTLEEQVAAKCPRVHMDRMAGDWIVATGDPKRRFRVAEEAGATKLWLTDPSVSGFRLELVGTRRERDWQFDEVPRHARKRIVDAGGEPLRRLYVEPDPRKCALKVFAGAVDAAGVETVPPQPTEFLMWPDGAPAFTFRPFDEELFVGKAATDAAAADKELAEHGAPLAMAEMGSVTVGVHAAADEGAGCTLTYDAFFDGQAVAEAQPAPPATAGKRTWSHTFDAPYSGNHRFELHRFQQCEGGARTLVSVAGADIALQ